MALSNLRVAEISHQVWHSALTKRIVDFNMLLCRYSCDSLKDIDRLIEAITQARAELDYIEVSMNYYSRKVEQIYSMENKECKN